MVRVWQKPIPVAVIVDITLSVRKQMGLGGKRVVKFGWRGQVVVPRASLTCDADGHAHTCETDRG